MASLRGATADRVLRAIAEETPFTGDAGFGGALPDGRIVRDVLGRVPVFVDPDQPTDWAFDPRRLGSARPLSPGAVVSGEGTVRTVWSIPSPTPFTDDVTARRRVDTAIIDTCADLDTRNAAIAYSGGVDSHLLATLLDAPRVTVGFSNSSDLTWARTANEHLDDAHLVASITHAKLEEAIPVVADATGRTNAMDVAIGVSLYLTAKRAAEAGHDRLILGQGADELFGGYEKIAEPDHRTVADTPTGARREVLEELPSGLTRDVLAVRAAGVEPVMPYLSDAVVRAGLRLDGSQLATDGRRKPILRTVAGEYVPAAIASREKSAIQYGSDVSTEVDRLARQAGYKRRMSHHVDRYVRSLQREAAETR